ncbi:MAG: nuclear transport factor 2 family protein [Gammaproteobacteria bacterium]|nr:nuclear transport factor 2 family protein [Gammaproteobacteria bacterium]
MKNTAHLSQESEHDQEPAGTTDRYRKTLELFSAAWSRGDIDSLLNLMGDEPVYKGSTGAGPGTFYSGREEVRAAFEKMAGGNAGACEPLTPATSPEMYFFSNRALVYWNLVLPGADGSPQRVDGVDIIEFTGDGRISVKDAYRKSFS